MTRLLLLFGLFLVAAYLVADRVALLLGGAGDGGTRNKGFARTSRADRDAEAQRELVACASCGVHVPRARALEVSPAATEPDARFCCSESCRARLAAVRR